jgi:phage repressor protein C with HTH and peptisase S24 domain
MLANRLKEFRLRADLSMHALATRLGTTASQISKLEKGQLRMTVDWMTRLAGALGIEPKDLLPAEPAASGRASGTAGLLPGGEARLGPTPVPSNPRDLIPVRSAARGGNEQEMFLQDGPIDFIRRPSALAHVRDAYAIYMVGDSMHPRFRLGQLLHVNPFKPPQPGSGVVITRTDDAVLIKEFVRRSPTVLTVRQYNPEKMIDYPLAEIRDIHTVVGLEEP